MLSLTFVLTWGIIVVNNPYLIAILFGQTLLLIACFLRSFCKFIAFILFLVYIGGIMILIRYCVILLPYNKFGNLTITAAVVGAVFLERSLTMPGSHAYGLLYRARVIFLVALLLYLVILAIVGIIDYSSGMMKYGQHGYL